jgi:hypothetical protein
MPIQNPVLYDGVAPVNIRYAIRTIIKEAFIEHLGTSVRTYHDGVWHVSALRAFPSLCFISGSEEALAGGKSINTKNEFAFTIVVEGYIRADNPAVLEEQMDNLIHACKKVVYVNRETKFGDSLYIMDAIPGNINVLTEYLPAGYSGFSLNLVILYRTFLPNV